MNEPETAIAFLQIKTVAIVLVNDSVTVVTNLHPQGSDDASKRNFALCADIIDTTDTAKLGKCHEI
jgi:hypothetical protein